MMEAKIAVFAGLVVMLGTGCHKPPPAVPPPPKVAVITVSPRDVPVYQEWIGTMDGYPNAQIRAQVSGYLVKQNYREGATVNQGDPLFEIDPRPFQAALDQALAKEKQDEAVLGKTELDLKRFTPLAKTQAISQEQLDDALQANLVAKAALAADKAAVESAQLNLSFTRILAPVTGVAGIAQAQLGDLVGPATGPLTTVSTVNPIRVYFNISEQFYLAYFHPSDSPAGERQRLEDVPLRLILADNSVFPTAGKWIMTGRHVDVSTGTLQVAAEFENPNNFLRPGQYGLVRAQTEIRRGALVVPQRAVIELQGAWQVAVVDSTNTVHIKTVSIGRQMGSEWLIESGLQGGERVVVEGTQKVRDGLKVEPEAYLAAAPSGQANAASMGDKPK
ncbi:MAG TPA: efflux RND transporter periplasmic adaptor subunit [Bryobacteraceae bacterium]|nr:efflux RND transporter periplasmic adaptor subunit [Bryobacteraceae bacterium]